MSGSAGGSGKRTGGNAGTAPRLDPDQPWSWRLNISARSVRVLSDRPTTRQRRIWRRIRVLASPDTAGEKFTKYLPNLLLDRRGRNV
jgi:hypothetical protein